MVIIMHAIARWVCSLTMIVSYGIGTCCFIWVATLLKYMLERVGDSPVEFG